MSVPGQAAVVDLPAPGPTTRVDGYTVTLAGRLMPDMNHMLWLSVAKDGHPVSAGRFPRAELIAFRARDLEAALPALVPGDASGASSTLTFRVTMPEPGYWRFFVEFQASGAVHTAAVTRLVQ